jgi:hypothetical protein
MLISKIKIQTVQQYHEFFLLSERILAEYELLTYGSTEALLTDWLVSGPGSVHKMSPIHLSQPENNSPHRGSVYVSALASA